MINSEATLEGLLRVEGFGPQQLCSGVSEGFKAEFGRAKVVGREKDREISLTSRSDPAATGPVNISALVGASSIVICCCSEPATPRTAA